MVEFYINKHIISDEIEPIQTEPCPIDLFVGTRTHHGTRLSGLRPEAVVPRRSYGTYYGEGHFRESTYHITETIPLKDILKCIGNTHNGSQLKNPKISGGILSLTLLILNSKCAEGARDVRVL